MLGDSENLELIDTQLEFAIKPPRIVPPLATSVTNPPVKKYKQQTLLGFKIHKETENIRQGDVLPQQRCPHKEEINVAPAPAEKVDKGSPEELLNNLYPSPRSKCEARTPENTRQGGVLPQQICPQYVEINVTRPSRKRRQWKP